MSPVLPSAINQVHNAGFSLAHVPVVLLPFLEHTRLFSHLQAFALAGLSAINTHPISWPGSRFPTPGLKHKRLLQKQPLLYMSHVTHLPRHPVLQLPSSISSYTLSIVISTLHVLIGLILTTKLGGRRCHYPLLRGEKTECKRPHVS